MQIDGWKYYNHAAISTVAPHEDPDMVPIKNGNIWKISGGTPLLARWTTEFDCGYQTNWWYVIKDTPFDINELKAKRRYEINRGIKNFDVRVIDPREYADELYEVQVAAFSAYPSKYRPTVVKEEFVSSLNYLDEYTVFGAFFRETDKLTGYATINEKNKKSKDFRVLKTDPEYEKYSINAALIEKILSHYELLLSSGGYISDGAKNISHETHFQDYLEKYFDFRKAYCRLHIAYNPIIKPFVKVLYPFKSLLRKLDGIGIFHKINSVIKMEEIVRKSKNV